MDLVDLTTCPHVIPLLAGWHIREWQHLYPGWTVEAATSELEATTSRSIPHTIVAFDGSSREVDDVIGSASLIEDDELPGLEDVGPWLASLFVRPGSRRVGAGRSLVAAAVDFAHACGVERLHLFATDSVDFYEGLGWRPITTASKNGHDVTVMAIDTDPHAPRRAFATDWCTSPWFRCAYSYLRPDGTPADRDLLGAPVAPGLVLTGEAASREFPGTAHGAWFSGEAAARRVLTDSPTTAVVVGAGMAGVAAARVLRDHGVDVTVLEATSQIGGRATSSRRLGGPVNVGAAWIHGTDGHPLHEPFMRRSPVIEPNTFRQTSTFLAGHGEVLGDRLAALADSASTVHQRLAAATVEARSGDNVADVLYPAIDDVADGAGAATVLRCWLRGEYENLYAASPSDLSLAHAAEPFRLPGADVMITVAADELVTDLADGLPISYDTPVRTITSRDDRWCVATDHGDLTADAVIVTVALGALRSDAIRFDPPLPQATRDAMARIGAGLVAKAFFSFDQAFWSPRRAFWIAADPPATFELWVDVTAVRGAPTLCAFAVGDTAVAVERMSEDELLDAAWATLRSAGGLVPRDR